jgi:hypothetical protein
VDMDYKQEVTKLVGRLINIDANAHLLALPFVELIEKAIKEDREARAKIPLSELSEWYPEI